MEKIFDIVIVGGGPSGCACAIGLNNSGLKVALLDKDAFPREKTCGDGLTLDSVNQLSLISKDLANSFHELKSKNPIYGINVFAANNKKLSVSILQKNEQRSMFTIKRIDFDNMLLQNVKQKTDIAVFENCQLKQIDKNDNSFHIHTSLGIFKSAFIIGADGANSIVAKTLRPLKIAHKDKAIALRNYYEGVNLDENEKYIEFYSSLNILPGGLWVFPVGNNIVNVGLGMQTSILKKKKINLKKVLDDEINNGVLKEAFKNAKPIDKLKGHIIPLGRKRRPISGERFLLTGDAACLANAFSGEGVGNALRSGRVAALHIIKGFEQNNFSKAFNLNYDKEIYRRMGREFYNYRLLQYLFRFPAIVNLLIGKLGPYFTDVFNKPEFLASFQGKRFFIFRIIKYFLFAKKNNI